MLSVKPMQGPLKNTAKPPFARDKFLKCRQICLKKNELEISDQSHLASAEAVNLILLCS
jgi:hypothetical protein